MKQFTLSLIEGEEEEALKVLQDAAELGVPIVVRVPPSSVGTVKRLRKQYGADKLTIEVDEALQISSHSQRARS